MGGGVKGGWAMGQRKYVIQNWKAVLMYLYISLFFLVMKTIPRHRKSQIWREKRLVVDGGS